MKTVLVTGASGFVGKFACPVLSRHFKVLSAIRDTRTGDYILPEGVDAVIHLAGRAHVMREERSDPTLVLQEYRSVNVEKTKALAAASVRAGVKRFIYVSSVKALGEGSGESGGVYDEQTRPDPKDPYGISKWEAEQALFDISARTGLEVVILRPPLIYGPEVKANFLKLLDAVAHRRPLPLGFVHNRRSMIYVGNFVDAIRVCIDAQAAPGQIYLVSDGQDLSTPVLIRKLGLALRVVPRLLPVPCWLLRLGGAMIGKSGVIERLLGTLQVDSRKIQDQLQWHPPFTVDEGLKVTAEWYLGKQQ